MNHEIKHIIKQSTTTTERKITRLSTDKVNPLIYGIHTSLFFSQKLTSLLQPQTSMFSLSRLISPGSTPVLPACFSNGKPLQNQSAPQNIYNGLSKSKNLLL